VDVDNIIGINKYTMNTIATMAHLFDPLTIRDLQFSNRGGRALYELTLFARISRLVLRIRCVGETRSKSCANSERTYSSKWHRAVSRQTLSQNQSPVCGRSPSRIGDCVTGP
jgi:hypothetical protein